MEHVLTMMFKQIMMFKQMLMLGDMLWGNDYSADEEDEPQSPRIWEIQDSDSNDEQIQQERDISTDKSPVFQQMQTSQSQHVSTQDSTAKSETTRQSTSLPATANNIGQKKGRKKKKGKKKGKKKKNSTAQQVQQQPAAQPVEQPAEQPAEQMESTTQNISVQEKHQAKLLTDKKNLDTVSDHVDKHNLIKDHITSCQSDKTEDIHKSQTSDQSNGKQRTIIMANQCETIRKTKDQINLDLATQGMTICIAVYITDKIGNASLTHMDAGTSLDFIEREIQWIKDQNVATDFRIKNDVMIHVIENRFETTNDALGGITPVVKKYLQKCYGSIKNLKGKACYDTSNVDKGNILIAAKLNKHGVIQHQLFQPSRQHLDEQFMHCIDGIKVSSTNPLKNYYIDKGQNYRDFDLRGATRGLMGFFKPINNLMIQGAKLHDKEYQAVVVFDTKWTNQFFELPHDIRLKVNRSKGTRLNQHRHDIGKLMLDHYWECQEKEKQRALKADENRLLQQKKAQQNQIKPTQHSAQQLNPSNQSILLPTTTTDSVRKAQKGQDIANNPSTGQQENMTDIQAKANDQSKLVADKKTQDTANDKFATLPEDDAVQRASDKVNKAAENNVKKSDNLQDCRKNMIIIGQHEGGIININENNIDNIRSY